MIHQFHRQAERLDRFGIGCAHLHGQLARDSGAAGIKGALEHRRLAGTFARIRGFHHDLSCVIERFADRSFKPDEIGLEQVDRAEEIDGRILVLRNPKGRAGLDRLNRRNWRRYRNGRLGLLPRRARLDRWAGEKQSRRKENRQKSTGFGQDHQRKRPFVRFGVINNADILIVTAASRLWQRSASPAHRPAPLLDPACPMRQSAAHQ